MIPMMGLTICFYIAMRGFDWLIVSKEAQYKGTYYGRAAVGVVTILGAAIFGLMWLSAGVDASSAYPNMQ
jgi:hypothetical protein